MRVLSSRTARRACRCEQARSIPSEQAGNNGAQRDKERAKKDAIANVKCDIAKLQCVKGEKPKRTELHALRAEHPSGKEECSCSLGRAPPVLREAFPSKRQARCSGLKRKYYPDYVREFVDYDYDEGLPEEAKVWLAAFTEEYYRGWRLKRETQLHSLEHLQRAGAEKMARSRHRDPLGFGIHRGEGDGLEVPTRNPEAELVDALDDRRSR